VEEALKAYKNGLPVTHTLYRGIQFSLNETQTLEFHSAQTISQAYQDLRDAQNALFVSESAINYNELRTAYGNFIFAVEESLPNPISDSNLTNFLNQVLQSGLKSSLPSGSLNQFITEDPILPPEMEALNQVTTSGRFHNEVLNQLRCLGGRHLNTTQYSPTHNNFSGWDSMSTRVP